MTFISYAQNFEDVMLWRALKNIEKGFYIDVGANDPEIDSVTKAFYDRGWRGINIEPVTEWQERLQKYRTHDINLQIAAGARKGNISFYEVPGTGLSTSCQKFAKQHAQERGFTHKKIKVPVETLTAICNQYAQSDIHFLKIDVEGAEGAVLKGLNFKKFRPWILVIETNLPNSVEESHQDWEELVLAADYGLAYKDGLNRFYVAKERSQLLGVLVYPPNVFDDFIPSQQIKSELRAQQAESQQIKSELRAQQAESRAKQAEAAADNTWVQYQAVINSTTWRMTAPLRWVIDGVKWFVRGTVVWLTLRPGSRPRRMVGLAMLHLRNWVILRPRVMTSLLSILQRFPRVLAWLKRLHYANPKQVMYLPTSSITEDIPEIFENSLPNEGLERLTPRARKIYADLQLAVAKWQKEGS